MLKVLVADEDLEANKTCCQYLSIDKNLDIFSVNTGINTLTKYREIQPNILIINSNFKDKNYIEIINELSSTKAERDKCNIILSLDEKNIVTDNHYKLNIMAKIYMQFKEVNYYKIKDGIDLYNWDHILFSEPNEMTLRSLFYKINLYNECLGADYFKFSIIQCYNNPSLLKDLNTIFNITSHEFNVSLKSIRPAMRNALISVNKYRDRNKSIGLMKLFINEDSITPKKFIKIITEYYLEHKK